MYSLNESMYHLLFKVINTHRLIDRVDEWIAPFQSRNDSILSLPNHGPASLQFPIHTGLPESPLAIIQRIQVDSSSVQPVNLKKDIQATTKSGQPSHGYFLKNVIAIIFPVSKESSWDVILLILDEDIPRIVDFISILTNIEKDPNHKNQSLPTPTVESSAGNINIVANIDDEDRGE